MDPNQAIKERLCIVRGTTPLLGPSYWYPVAVDEAGVVLRDCDCGLARPTVTITMDEWAERSTHLYKKVGMWDFVPAADEAADAIRRCHADADSAGRALHRAESSRAELASEVERLRDERDDARGDLASVTDHVNTYCRENSLPEADSEATVKDAINQIAWTLARRSVENAALRALLREARKSLVYEIDQTPSVTREKEVRDDLCRLDAALGAGKETQP